MMKTKMMTNRLIDANSLHQDIAFAEFDTVQDRLFITEIIHHAPTVDAVPVVHGRWEILDFAGYMRCSVCGQIMDGYYNYCPHCGAKMDGDKND